MVDGCKLVNVVSGVPEGSVVCSLLFFLYTSELFSILENKLFCYADDFTLLAVMPSSGIRVAVAESPNRDLGKVIQCCGLFGLKLNAGTAKTLRVSRSCLVHPIAPPPLTIGGTVLKQSDDNNTFGVTFDWKMTFEKHLRSVSRAVSQRLGISRISWRVFNDRLLIERCLCCFLNLSNWTV